MTVVEKETVIDLYVLGLMPKDIAYTTGFGAREVRTVCEEFELQMKKERIGFMNELKDKGFINKQKAWKWGWKPSKITISLN